MLFRVLDDPIIGHLHIACASGHRIISRARDQIPQRHRLETVQPRVLPRAVRPGRVFVENSFVVEVGLKAGGDLLVPAFNSDGLLDRAFEGGEFGATVYASLDVAARGETIEFGTDIGIEVLVHGLVAVVGPDLLLEC